MDTPISPGGIHAHIYTRNVPMHTSVESGYLLYLQNQEKENKVISGYMPRSATYTSGRVPPCAGCIYQLFNMQRVVVCWWWSSTSDWLRSTAYPVLITCSAKADVWTSPFFISACIWRCSLTGGGGGGRVGDTHSESAADTYIYAYTPICILLTFTLNH